MKKHILPVLLAFSLSFSLTPGAALATEKEDLPQSVELGAALPDPNAEPDAQLDETEGGESNGAAPTGNTALETLKTALQSAQSGDTVALTENITIGSDDLAGIKANDAVITVPSGVTLDGGSKTITATGWSESNKHHILSVENAADVTIKDLTIEGNTNTKSGIHMYQSTNVQLNNVTIKSCGNAALEVNGSTVTATGLTTESNAWGAVNVDRGQGVTTAASFTLAGSSSLGEDAKIWAEKEDVTITVPAGWASAKRRDGKTHYAPLTDTIEKAAAGATVKLLGDAALNSTIDITKALTLDLNGKAITSNDGAAFITRTAGVTFTITDSAAGGKITSTNASKNLLEVCAGELVIEGGELSSKWYTIYAFQSGKVTVKGGKVTSDVASAVGTNGSGQGSENYSGDAVIDIQGGELVSTNDVTIYLPAGTLKITNGEITGATAVYSKAGTTTITGGTIKGTGAKTAFAHSNNGCSATGDAIVVEACAYPNGNPKVSISGSVVVTSMSANAVASYVFNDQPQVLNFITGGTFSTDPSKVPVSEGSEETVSYVASGYQVTETDGSFKVSRKPTPSSSSGSSSSTTTTTQVNEDGSVTTTTTDHNTGTVTTTDKAVDGSTTKTVENPDGSSQVDIAQADGTTATVTTDPAGKTEAQVDLSREALAAAQDSGKPAALPIPALEAAADRDAAPAVAVALPAGAGSAKVEIPVEAISPTVVAVVVRPDGTEEIMMDCVPSEDGLIVPVDGELSVKLVDNAKDFNDLPDAHWAKDSMDFVAAREIFQGVAKDTFAPDLPMTRAMLFTVLARLEGEEPADDESWYGAARDLAVAKGISDGTRPEAEITREQLATMLYRYFGKPQTAGDLSAFPDAAGVSPFAADAMKWAVEQGIIKGMGDGTLAPTANATRAQVSAILARFLQLN